MKIVVDAFGGDNAPDEVVKGAVDAVKEYGVTVVLTGDTKKLDECFAKLGLLKDGIEFAEADGVIEIEDNPKEILKEKKNSSMGVALTMVAEGKADAMVSAGSTAALVMGGTLIVKRIKGVKRPSLTPVMPGVDNLYVLLDGGANVDCRPDMLRQFAVMGSVYMNKVMGVAKPRVGLVLSVFGLMSHQMHLILNLMEYVLLIFTGSNFPVTQLPEVLQVVSYALPLTRSITAARGIVNGMELNQVFILLSGEILVGIAYIILATALVKYAERVAVKKGTLELF